MKVGELIKQAPEKAPVIRTGLVIKDGVPPQGEYLTVNTPELYQVQLHQWVLPENPRMDGVAQVITEKVTLDDNVELRRNVRVVEMNKLKAGDEVVLATTDDGSEGVLIPDLQESTGAHEKFSFMITEISRERKINYRKLADVLKKAKDGKIVWVLGPAVAHSGGINDMQWLIENGYVGALLGGNAIAVHDIEHAISRTSLGNDDDSVPVHNGHRNHLEAIAHVREAGSIEEAVRQGVIAEGIMYSCVKNNVPFVLAGSIRDDGPLPDVITDVIQSQDAMREHTKMASAVVMVATVLHSVATGNMTPTYRVSGDEIVPVPVICADMDEFAVTKLADRGTGQAYPALTNAQDFLHNLVVELQKPS